MKVKECKLLEPKSVDEEKSVLEVAKVLKKNKVRQVTITKDKTPVGIVSAVDIVNKIVAEGKDPSKVHAKDIMTSPIVTCNSDDPAFHTYLHMSEKNIMSCPVVEGEKFIGTITIQSLMMDLNKKAQEMGSKEKE